MGRITILHWVPFCLDLRHKSVIICLFVYSPTITAFPGFSLPCVYHFMILQASLFCGVAGKMG